MTISTTKINNKRKSVAAWLGGAMLVGVVAGCGGGSSSQRPVAVADAGEILFTVARTIPGGSPEFPIREVDLFSANPDGSNRTLIPTSGPSDPDSAQWLPGRREIIYTDSNSPGIIVSSIRRVNRDGSNDREIIPVMQLRFVSGLTVSPDGRRIAYSSRNEVRVSKVDGTDTAIIAEGSRPMWSPDGRRLVFSGQTGFRVVNADGSSLGPQIPGSSPDWSPDGRRLVFQDQVGEASFLFVVNADGSNRTRVTAVTQQPAFPSWSPDGRRIAYLASLPDNPTKIELFVVNANGSNPKQITTDAGTIFFRPRWTPNGASLVFASFPPGNNALFIVNADGSNQRQTFSTPGRINFDFDLR